MSEDYEHLGPLFEKPPLLQGEEGSYRELLTKVSSALRPDDIFERIFAAEFAYRAIEVVRLRRVSLNLIRVNEYIGLRDVLTPIVGRLQAETLAAGWAAQKPDVVKEVKKLLRSAGLNLDSITSQTFALKLNDVACISHMVALAEARRDAILREIYRHRKMLGEELRRVAQQFEHDQLKLVESASISVDGSV